MESADSVLISDEAIMFTSHAYIWKRHESAWIYTKCCVPDVVIAEGEKKLPMFYHLGSNNCKLFQLFSTLTRAIIILDTYLEGGCFGLRKFKNMYPPITCMRCVTKLIVQVVLVKQNCIQELTMELIHRDFSLIQFYFIFF